MTAESLVCPRCGIRFAATAGVRWMTCTGCPLALDPFAVSAERLPAFRPEGAGTDAAQRLAFHVFESGTLESPVWIWIPAFRALSASSRSAPGAVLERKGYRPDLRAARLVSLACRVSMGNVAEKVSGFAWPFGTLRPPVT